MNKKVLIPVLISTTLLLQGCAENKSLPVDFEVEKEAILQTIATETEAYFIICRERICNHVINTS